MKEYFKEQLEDGEAKPITKEKLSLIKGKSLYSDYQEGDIFLVFFEHEKTPENEIIFHVRTVCERELEKVSEEYNYIENKGKFPVLERNV